MPEWRLTLREEGLAQKIPKVYLPGGFLVGSCEVTETILVRQESLENGLSHELRLNSIGVMADFWLANVTTPPGRR